jgi:NADPH-dependent 2,4-dienoyl-CoA reductase/sulfur reductase-like enzyme
MQNHDYLIIGGGMTAAAAAKGIREVDPAGSIGVIAAEDGSPYKRPPLSKQLWTGKRKVEDIWLPLPEGARLYAGQKAAAIDRAGRRVADDQGQQYGYTNLLLATGGTPRRLPFGGENIIYYRDIISYTRLRGLAAEFDRFAVIGGGFIGSEIAAALAMQGKNVTMLFPEEAIGARLFPAGLAAFLNDYYREKGVEVLAGATANGLAGEEAELELLLDDGRRLAVNGVVAGIGIRPNVELAEAAGLAVDDGIVVDGRLRTEDANIYAAGDVANFPDPLLGERRRVEHEDAANSMGRAAGRAMAGDPAGYDSSPYFYSDMFDLGYEAVGRIDARLETVADWREPNREGVVYYLEGGRVRGVLLWNVWDRVDDARALLRENGPFDAASLRGRL